MDRRIRPLAAGAFIVAAGSASAFAADYPAPQDGDWVARDFKFHTGEVIPELRLHYITVGEPSGQPVLVMHGTNGAARSMLLPASTPENCSAPANRSMPASISSSCLMRSVTGSHRSRPTGCG